MFCELAHWRTCAKCHKIVAKMSYKMFCEFSPRWSAVWYVERSV